jgi:hypothetical protein
MKDIPDNTRLTKPKYKLEYGNSKSREINTKIKPQSILR